MDRRHACPQDSAWWCAMMACKCRKSTCRNMCQCRILGLECTDLCKCSRSCNNEKKTNDIESEIDDENDGNNEQSEASDANSQEEDW